MLSNEKIKYYFSLKKKKIRQLNEKIIVEGERLIFEILLSNIPLDIIITSIKQNDLSKTSTNIISKAKKQGIVIEFVDDKIIKKLSNTKNNQSFIAVCNLPKYKKIDYNKNILALDHISDPGNMGTLLRTAEWFGIKNIILSKNCVDPFNSKVIRGAMGAHFYLNSIQSCKLNEKLLKLKNLGYSVLGADKKGKHISKLNIKSKWVLIIGNEANGLSDDVLQNLTDLISIPGYGNIESLNAAVAGSILLNLLIK